jgi:hypothetical protein
MLIATGAMVAALVTPTNAAILEPLWTEDVGDMTNDVAVAPDGSVYVAGVEPAAEPATWLALLTKMTPQGDVIWTHTFTPNQRVGTWGTAVAVAPDGRVAWVGASQKWNCEGGGWWLEILGPAGGVIDRTVSRAWRCTEQPQGASDVAIDADLVVVTGFRYGCCGQADLIDGWVRAFEPNGSPRWLVNLDPPAPTPTSWYDEARSVAIGPTKVFVAGWASTTEPSYEGSPREGTMLLTAFTKDGQIVWNERVPSVNGAGILDVHGNALMVTALDGGRGMEWRYGPRASNGWIGRFTTAGDLVWSRAWDTRRPNAAAPDALAIDGAGAAWVVGTRRDPVDMGYDVFVRRFGPNGAVLGALSFDEGQLYLEGSGVATRSGGAYVAGSIGKNPLWDGLGGLLWRVAA